MVLWRHLLSFPFNRSYTLCKMSSRCLFSKGSSLSKFKAHLRRQALAKCIMKRSSSNGEDRFSYLADRGYWEEFYKRPDKQSQFDWLASYDIIVDRLPLPPKPFTLLDVGCGISEFTPKLVAQTPQLETAYCVDFCHAAIETILIQNRQNNTQTAAENKLVGVVADAKKLPFRDATFDVIFDKGTTDSVLKGRDGVNEATSILSECLRVLAPGGAVVQVTDEDPDLRGALLRRISQRPLDIGFSVLRESSDQEYFLYRIKAT